MTVAEPLAGLVRKYAEQAETEAWTAKARSAAALAMQQAQLIKLIRPNLHIQAIQVHDTWQQTDC